MNNNENISSKFSQRLDLPPSRAVRNAHIGVLAERTELEIFLRQCIDDVREEIMKRSKSPTKYSNKQSVTFTVSDRQKVMDLILSKERVLNMLYEKTFPKKVSHYKPPLSNAYSEPDLIEKVSLQSLQKLFEPGESPLKDFNEFLSKEIEERKKQQEEHKEFLKKNIPDYRETPTPDFLV